MALRDEQLETTARVSEMAATGLPLEPGLRALAEEAPSRRMRRALLGVCRRLERGERLDQVVAAPDSGLPLHVAGLLSAGLRTGQMAELLTRYIEQARRWQDLRRQALGALIYPAVLLVVAAAVLAFYMTWIVPGMKLIFEDFDTELPYATIALLRVSDFLVSYGPWLLLAVPAIAFGIPALVIVWGGRPLWRRLVSFVPLFGPMLRYSALAEFCHLLALVLRHDTPLPDALRIAAVGTPDADVAASIIQLARASESGRRLEDADFGRLRLPLMLRGSFRWEGHGSALPSSLEAAGEVFASLAAVQSGLLRMIAGPAVIVATAVVLAGLVVLLVAPLIKLLNDLS